tara:strand:- start:134 stop:631 length:498 start_codon:yes stop_codon:yes gene_type:complete
MRLEHWLPAYIGIGSNLGDSIKFIDSAILSLSQIESIRIIEQSRVYRSKPLGPQDQPDFFNVVISVLTYLGPKSLLESMHDIEMFHGREREQRWGARTLDLDLLAVAGKIFDDPDLILPHPRISERNFVLYPWCEIAPNFQIPNLGLVKDLTECAPKIPEIKLIE